MNSYQIIKFLFINLCFILLLSTIVACENSNEHNNSSQDLATLQSQGVAQLGYISNATVLLFKATNLTVPISTTTSSKTNIPENAGTFVFRNIDVSKNDYYVIQVIGGEDIDPNDSGVIEESNKQELKGSFYGVLKGSHLINNNYRITAISDIIFRFVNHKLNINANELEVLLNEKSKTVIKNDINGDNVINYDDVLAFNPVKDSISTIISFQSVLSNYVKLIHEGSNSDTIDNAALDACKHEILINNSFDNIIIPFNLKASISVPQSIEIKWELNSVKKEKMEQIINKEGSYSIVAKMYQEGNYIGERSKVIIASSITEIGTGEAKIDEDAEIYVYDTAETSLAGTTIFIPKGSVTENMQISVKTLNNGTILPGNTGIDISNVLVLEPSGINFFEPLTISMPYEADVHPEKRISL